MVRPTHVGVKKSFIKSSKAGGDTVKISGTVKSPGDTIRSPRDVRSSCSIKSVRGVKSPKSVKSFNKRNNGAGKKGKEDELLALEIDVRSDSKQKTNLDVLNFVDVPVFVSQRTEQSGQTTVARVASPLTE